MRKIIKLIFDLFKADFHLVLDSDMFPDLLLSFLNGLLKNLVIFNLDVVFPAFDGLAFSALVLLEIVDLLCHVEKTELIDFEQFVCEWYFLLLKFILCWVKNYVNIGHELCWKDTFSFLQELIFVSNQLNTFKRLSLNCFTNWNID